MDFLDPAKKRAHAIRLYIGYALMAVAILTGTMVLLFASYGFDIDRKTGAIIQNGLIFLSARPEPADIYLNGKLHKSQTDSRLTLPSGEYDIELRRSGYRPWKYRVNLLGAGIERLVYPLLFPENPVTKDVQLYASQPPLSTVSPDRRWLLVQQPGSLSNFDLFDIVNDTVPSTIISLPGGLMTASDLPQSLEVVEWSTDNRHILMLHRFGSASEFIIFDTRAPGSSFNVNRLFNRNPSQVVLRDKRFDRLYLFEEPSGLLSTADVRTRGVAPLIDRVRAFKPHGDDQLLYVTDKSAPSGQVNVNIMEGNDSFTIRHLPDNSSYMLDVARFEGAWYMAVTAAKDGRVYIYRNPLDQLRSNRFESAVPYSLFKIDNLATMAFSDNARFLMGQGGKVLVVHDFETKRRFDYEAPLPVQTGTSAKWMDGHRLTVLSEGRVGVFDFDGTNAQTLAPSAVPAAFNRDFTSMFTIAPSKSVQGRSSLQQTALKMK